MEALNHNAYDIDKSSERMDDILNAEPGNFSDASSVQSREKLTYTNGFYVNVTALFVDIVGSSDMTNEHNRPTLAKMYRSYISECTAIMNSDENCKEINIHGDCVWGIFDTPQNEDVDIVFARAAGLNSLINILNYKLKKKKYPTISVGIGMDYGRALMIKAGYAGSGLNDVVWMGDVVNIASHLSGIAGRDRKPRLIITPNIYSKLNEDNKKLLKRTVINENIYYQGDVICSSMNKWYTENCK